MELSKKLVGIVASKNRKSEFIACNDVLLEYVDAKSDDAVLGLTDCDLPWNAYAGLYRSHEEDALGGQNYSTIIPVTLHNGDTRLFVHNKYATEKQDETVVHCHAVEIINPNVYKLAQAISIKTVKTPCLKVGKQLSGISLSKRQEETLFLLIRGKSAKAIGQLLGISPRTVEYYIDLIKAKFDCSSKQELVEKVIYADYDQFVPKHLTLSSLLKYLD